MWITSRNHFAFMAMRLFEGIEGQWWGKEKCLNGWKEDSVMPLTSLTSLFSCLSPGGELFMQLEKEGIFMEDTAW